MTTLSTHLPPLDGELTALPCTIRAENGLIERSYPGAPGVVGWTLFLRTSAAYLYHGDPVFAAQPDAIRHLGKRYGVKTRLN